MNAVQLATEGRVAPERGLERRTGGLANTSKPVDDSCSAVGADGSCAGCGAGALDLLACSGTLADAVPLPGRVVRVDEKDVGVAGKVVVAEFSRGLSGVVDLEVVVWVRERYFCSRRRRR